MSHGRRVFSKTTEPTVCRRRSVIPVTVREVTYDFLLFRGPLNSAPVVADQAFTVDENVLEVGIVVATDEDLPNDTLSYSISGGADQGLFTIDQATGAVAFLNAPDYEMPQDEDADNIYEFQVTVSDQVGVTDTAQITVNVLNLASITGNVFVDVNQNRQYDADEMGIDGVVIQLLDEFGEAVLDEYGQAITATTSDGGSYLFEDLDPGTYQIHELQPTGVDDGVELLGNLDGSHIANDTMQLTLNRIDATDYLFTEFGQQVGSGDTATIGFWQNKHGQQLIQEGGAALASWLSGNFGNIFGDTFSDGLGGDNGAEVATFYKQELFKEKAHRSAGPAKVDAQFMATALATYIEKQEKHSVPNWDRQVALAFLIGRIVDSKPNRFAVSIVQASSPKGSPRVTQWRNALISFSLNASLTRSAQGGKRRTGHGASSIGDSPPSQLNDP